MASISPEQGTRFVLVRHGETEWNIEGRMQGHLDSPLTENGRAQATAIGRRVSAIGARALYSSDLGRARSTALAIAAQCGLEPVYDDRLRERKLGIFEGLTEPEIRSRHAAEWARFLERDPDYAMPEGESARGRTERALRCLRELASSHSGETIVVVTHGGILDGLFRIVAGVPLGAPRNFVISNGALNIIRCDSGRWMLEAWGCRDHLGSTDSLDDL